MSSPATSAFLTAWRKLDAKRRALARIELTEPSALTLFYATTETLTPDGQLWQLGLSCEPIRESVELLGPGMNPVEATIRLAKRQDAAQAAGLAGGSTVHDLPSRFLFQNALVTLYLWETTLTDFADALQVFQGKVSRPVDITPDGITFHLLQDLSWNEIVPPTVVDKVNFPDSPDVSQGLPLPIVYGDHRALALRSPWSAAYTDKSKQEDAGAGLGAVPLVLVNAGVGNAKVKVVAGDHAMADILSRSTGYSAFIVGDNLLDPLDTAGITETLTAPANLEIADESTIAYHAIIPIDVRASESTATNPRNAMDPFDETAYAILDQATAKNELQLILPSGGSLGRIESVAYSVAYSGDAANANNMRIRARQPGVGFGTTSANWAATATTPAVATGTWNTADYNAQNWTFGENAAGTQAIDVRIDFTGGATNKGRIYWVALVVKYRPNRSVVTPGKRVVSGRVPRVPRQPPIGGQPPLRLLYTDILPTLKLEGQFYGNVKGYQDDGGGTYTGTGSALIERPPDIIRHFLETYAGASGLVETGVGATGSFVDARDVLRNAGPSDLKLACWIGERSNVQRVVQGMAEQAGLCIYLDRFTGQWLCFVWKPGAAVDYDRTLSWYKGDFASVAAEETSVVDVRTAIRVKFGFDHFKQRTQHEAFVNADGSGQGLNFPTQRDQKLAVDATNEDIDWMDGVAKAATLTHDDYTPIELAHHIRAQMRAVEGDNSKDVGYGFTIVAGGNDLIDFVVAGNTYQATVAPGDHTAESLAQAVAVALNAVGVPSITFSCSYSHSTNQFTISATANFQITINGAGVATNAAHVLAFYAATAVAASATGGARYAKRFWFWETSLFTLLWSTGASAATNCANLLGFPKADATTRFALYSRGDRERTADEFQDFYGPREERQITADWVRDENTAVELRDRIFDMTASPRVIVRFASFRCPDVRRMQVIQLDADLDAFVAHPKYGGGGSWAGKPLRVLEVEQNMETFQTEVLAIGAE